MAVDDFRQHVGHVGLRIDAVELAGLDERGDDRPILGPAVRAGEESIFAIEGNGSDCALDDIGVDLDAPVVDKARQAVPARQRIADRLGELGLLADQRELVPQPGLERVDDRAGFFLSRRAPSIGIASAEFRWPKIEDGVMRLSYARRIRSVALGEHCRRTIPIPRHGATRFSRSWRAIAHPSA